MARDDAHHHKLTRRQMSNCCILCYTSQQAWDWSSSSFTSISMFTFLNMLSNELFFLFHLSSSCSSSSLPSGPEPCPSLWNLSHLLNLHGTWYSRREFIPYLSSPFIFANSVHFALFLLGAPGIFWHEDTSKLKVHSQLDSASACASIIPLPLLCILHPFKRVQTADWRMTGYLWGASAVGKK